MKRTYEQDIADVKAVQAGDNEAWARLLSEYRPNLTRMARKYEGVLSTEDAVAIATSALAEYVMTATEHQAQYLRNKVSFIVEDAMGEYLHPGMTARHSRSLRAASTAMRRPVGDEPAALTLAQAAAKFGADVGTLEGFRAVSSTISVEETFYLAAEDALDEGCDAQDEITLVDTLPSAVVSESMSRIARVRTVVEAFPPQRRRVAEMLMAGMSTHEIGREMGIAPQAVRRARSLMASALAPML